MLYYRLYKRMKKQVGFVSAVSPSLDYALFAIIVPMIAGSVVALMLQRFLGVSENASFLAVILFVAVAALYIQLCERYDKEP